MFVFTCMYCHLPMIVPLTRIRSSRYSYILYNSTEVDIAGISREMVNILILKFAGD
jgi:hypothetical protein